MNLYLVRHGECTDTKGIYIGSGSDISINSIGVKQIDGVALELQKILGSNAVTIISSSLKRAVESSNIITKKLGVEFSVDSRLNEIDFGLWEGLNYNQIMEGWRDIATKWYNNPFDISPPNGEDFSSFYNRINNILNDLKESYSGNIILVTHGGVIQTLLTILNSDSIDNRWNYNIERGTFRHFKL